MRTLVLLFALLSVSAHAYTLTELDPLPPASANVPATASRYVDCVGVDGNGVVACNAVYIWKRYVNRFCCTYQRDLAFTVANGVVTFLTPASGKSDTHVTSVSPNGRIAGDSSGAKRSLLVATIWIHGVPATYPGNSATAISNTAYVLDKNQAIEFASGLSIKPAQCTTVYAVNDAGDGLCWAVDLVGGPTSEHVGLARFSHPTDDGTFLNQGTPASIYAANINHAGQVVGVISNPPYSYGLFARAGSDVPSAAPGLLYGQNNRGDRVGSSTAGGMAWIAGAAINLTQAAGLPAGKTVAAGKAINNGRVIAGQIAYANSNKRTGFVLTP